MIPQTRLTQQAPSLKILAKYESVCDKLPLMCVCVCVLLIGGRNHDGCPILKLTQPNTVDEGMLKDITEEGVIDMLIYFTSVPRYIHMFVT